MKIALVLAGGVDRSEERRVIPVVLALIGRLAMRHEVHVFALRQDPTPGEWPLRGARVHNIGSTRALHRAIARIWREHRTGPFDVVHALWGGASALVAALGAKLVRRPLCVHLTGGELVGLRDIGYGQLLSPHWRWLNQRVFANAARITATSDLMVDLAARIGVAATRVPLGVALDEWPPLEPRPRSVSGAARLIQVASLNRVKNLELTLAALSRLHARGRNFIIDFVGEDTLDGKIQELAAKSGLAASTNFHGFLTQRELRPLMERAHIHLVSSRHEAGPAAALEAAIAGVPTVGTEVGHLAEWSSRGASVVSPADPDSFATAIDALLRDDAERLAIAGRAQSFAIAEGADYTAACFEEMYREVITH